MARHGVRATFFVLGENVARHPDFLRRIVAEGHGVGIHGYHHVPFVLLSWKGVGEEIARTRAAIRASLSTGRRSRLAATAARLQDADAALVARHAGCRLVAWTVNARDYRCSDLEVIAQTVLNGLRPGAIVLLHDGPQNMATVEALSGILDGLRESGYGCVSL